VCSPVLMSFQYHAGPRSSYRLISCRAKDWVFPNGSGSLITGVAELSGEVRSTTSTRASRIAEMRASSTGMAGLRGASVIRGDPQTTHRERGRRNVVGGGSITAPAVAQNGNMSEPEGRGAAWSEERETSDEGRRCQ